MFKKVLFLLFTLGNLTWMTYQIHEIIKEYALYEVDTSVTYVTARKLAYPSVTVCNMNPVRKSALDSGLSKILNDSRSADSTLTRKKRDAIGIRRVNKNIQYTVIMCFNFWTLSHFLNNVIA